MPRWKTGLVTPDISKITLRYTNALTNKRKQYDKSRKAGIIGPEDGFILAINSRYFDNEPYNKLPIYLQGFLPIGDLAVEFNKSNKSHSKPYFKREDKIRKSNDSLVSKNNFLNEKYSFCSAILHSSVSYFHVKINNDENEDTIDHDFSMLHNPLASFPLNCNKLNWCLQYSVSKCLDGSLNVKNITTELLSTIHSR